MKRLFGFAVMLGCAAALSFGNASAAFAVTESAEAQIQEIADTDTTNTENIGAETAAAEEAEENREAEAAAAEKAAAAAEAAEPEAEAAAEETAQDNKEAGLPVMMGDTADEAEEALAREKEELRQEVVDYALSFVGGRYVWGGEDPHSGADCSGFVRYVLSNTAGVSMSRSSYEQAREGATVSPEEMQPGDLLFYGNGRRVNHVAMYIGDGQIVHASTAKTGIKISRWNYRTPVRIASFIG